MVLLSINCRHPFSKNVCEISVLVGYKDNHLSGHMCVGETISVYGKGYTNIFESLCDFSVCDRKNYPNKM